MEEKVLILDHLLKMVQSDCNCRPTLTVIPCLFVLIRVGKPLLSLRHPQFQQPFNNNRGQRLNLTLLISFYLTKSISKESQLFIVIIIQEQISVEY